MSKRSAKAFLIAYVGLGVGPSVPLLLLGNYPAALMALLLVGPFVALMASHLSNRSDAALRDEGIEPGDYPLRPVLTLEISVPAASTWEAAKAAIQNVFGMESKPKADEVALIINARRPTSMRAFATLVEVHVTPTDIGADVRISSRPGISTTTSDAGQNYRNVALIERSLKQLLGESRIVRRSLVDADAA